MRREIGNKGNGTIDCPTDLLFFIAISPTKIGGIELFARHLGMAMALRKKTVTFCFSSPASEEVLSLLDLPNIRVAYLHDHSSFTLNSAASLWRILRRCRPQTVVYSFGGILRPLPWLCLVAGVKTIVYNDHASRTPEDLVVSSLKCTVAQVITYPVQQVIAVSDFVAASSRSERLHRAPCCSIPNGVDVARGEQSSSKAEFLSRYGIPSDRKIVTQVSWLIESKGVDVFLRAAGLVLRNRADVHFVVGGEGASRSKYEQLVQELGINRHVTFTGMISNPISAGIYAASDIFCLASRWMEACGLVLLEAMSHGVPVVATRTGGIPEYVRDNTDGLLVSGTPIDVADALNALLANDALRLAMGNAAKARVEKDFDVRLMAERYADLLAGPLVQVEKGIDASFAENPEILWMSNAAQKEKAPCKK